MRVENLVTAGLVFFLVGGVSARAAEPPVVMMRFSSEQTRSLDEWKQTAQAFAANRGCCDDIWFSTGESFPSLDWHRNHVKCVRAAAEDVRKLGISVSLQFEATIGHGDTFPTAEEKLRFDKPWTGWTGADGTECFYCNCPRQPGFLKRLADVSELYAVIHPAVVWIDDDLRPTSHAPVIGKDSPGCWCAKCVADFGAEEGRMRSRAELYAAYRQDAALRERWEDFSCRSLAEAACTIARAFRRVSPETRMGIQIGNDRVRMTRIVTRALAKETNAKVDIRMGGGAYWDIAPYRQIAKSTLMVAHRRELGLEDVVDNWCTEVESYPRAYGSRSVRSIAIESFVTMGWGFDTTSLFVMDRRSETDATYSRYLLKPLMGVTAFLNGYRAANRDTTPAGFTCPGIAFDDTRKLIGLPILPGLGRSWGTISSECEKFPHIGVVWGDFRSDLIPPFEKTPSAKLQIVRDRLSSAAPLELLSPFVGLVLPRVATDGEIRTVGLVGTRLDPQPQIVLRLDVNVTSVVWHELGEPSTTLPIENVAGHRCVTIPSLGAWNVGYLSCAQPSSR